MKLALLSISTLAFSLMANAASFTFDFTSATNAGAGIGNVRTFTSTDGQMTVTVTGWGLTSALNTQFAKGQLNQYSGYGLAVCDASERGELQLAFIAGR